MASYYSSWVANGTSSVSQAYRTRLDLTFNTGTSAQNYTDVTWSLYLENGNTKFADTRSLGHVTINGVKVWDYPITYTNSASSMKNSILLQAKDGTNKATGTLRVPHLDDGTKTIAFSTSFETVNKSLSFTAKSVMTSSGTIPLTTIPRYTNLTLNNSTNISRNGYSFSFSTTDTINRYDYSITVAGQADSWTSVTGDRTSATVSVGSLAPNTKYLTKVRAYRKDSGLYTEASSLTTTQAIASPNTPTISEITRNSFKINVTANKSFNGFQYNINDGAWSDKQSGTSVNVTGRTAGTTHQVRVKVYDGVHTSRLSGQSAAVSAVTVAAAAPHTPTLVSRTGVRAEVQWSSTQTAINVQYRLNGGGWISTGSNFSARSSGSFPVTGLAPGTTYAISTRVLDAVHTGTWSGASAGLNVTTYALCTVKGSDFNLGSNVTAQITESVVTMDYHIYLDAYYSGAWKNVASILGQGASATLGISASQIQVLEDAHPNTNNIRMRFRVIVYWQGSNETQGTVYSSDFTGRIVNANPTLSGITYKDNHSDIDFVNWKGGDQKILRNVSPVLATLGTATARKGAKLSHYVFNINGKSFTVNANGAATQTGAIRDLGVINSATNQNIEVIVYDSRGNSTPMSVPVSMLDYIAPQVLTIKAQRLNNYEPATTLVVSGRSYIVKPAADDVNTYTAKYRMKEAGTSTWPSVYTNVTTTKGTKSGNWQNYSVSHYMGTFDSDKSYDIQFVFQDSVGTQYIQNAVLTKGIGLMTFFEDKVELGVPLYDKNSTKKYLLEGEGGTDLVTVLKAVYPIGAIYTSVTATNPSSIFGFGTWVSFGAGRMLVGVNTADTDFNTAEKTGGSKTSTLAIANLPAHTHTFTGNATGSAGAHSHTITVNSGGAHAHTASSNSTGAHTHTTSGTAASAGNHTHTQDPDTWMNRAPNVYMPKKGSYYATIASTVGGTTGSAGAHTHTTSGTAASAGAHSHTITVNSGGAHAHTASSNSTGAHTHTVSGSNANTGSGTAFNTIDPYITVYMWKRTA